MNRFSNTQSSAIMNLPICLPQSGITNLPIRKSSTLIVFILFIFSMVPTNSFSQEIEWQNTIGGSWLDQLIFIQQTYDGGYILGGPSQSDIFGDVTDSGNGSKDYWIVKVDPLGNIQWQNMIGGSGWDALESIEQIADGGYILGGWSNSPVSGDKSEDCIGGNCNYRDYWVVKVDSLGTIQWENTIGGFYIDCLRSIRKTTDGGYILGGDSDSDIAGDKSEDSNGQNDYWIVKLDSMGSIQWQNDIGGGDYDNFESIQQTADEGYILGGWSSSNISGDKTENSNGLSDYWIVKVDSIGTIQWQNTIGGGGDDRLNSIEQTSDGGYILGGFSNSNISGDKTENSNGLYDYWIVKVDSIGTIQWQSTIGGSLYDELNSIQQTNDGGYILGGTSSSSISGDKVENGFFTTGDYWVVKVDSLGVIQWQNTIIGSFYDELNSIQQTNDGGYILGGSSLSDISMDKTENCIGSWDYWMVKLTDKYNLISGKLFADLNSNGYQDSGELFLPGQKITEQGTGRFSFSQTNGHYSVSVLDTGNFTVSTPSMLWYSPSPATHSATFIGIYQIDSLNDFAYQPIGSYDDVCVTITPLVG